MGGGTWTSGDWSSYSSKHIDGKSTAAIFTSRDLLDEFNPAKITMRESRDGADNPAATPIYLACDVTGSMGHTADKILRDGLNTVATEIRTRKPITDPHIGIMAVGDAYFDRAPLQVTQLEASVVLADQAKKLWIERGGGNNMGESYALPALFCATKVSADAWEKRGQKGFLFTMGDEPVLPMVTAEQARRVLGIEAQTDLSAQDIYATAARNWNCFHLILANEGYASRRLDEVERSWREVLPQGTILLDDIDALAETIVSLIQVTAGAQKTDVAASWGGSKALVVANALKSVPAMPGTGRGLQRLR